MLQNQMAQVGLLFVRLNIKHCALSQGFNKGHPASLPPSPPQPPTPGFDNSLNQEMSNFSAAGLQRHSQHGQPPLLSLLAFYASPWLRMVQLGSLLASLTHSYPAHLNQTWPSFSSELPLFREPTLSIYTCPDLLHFKCPIQHKQNWNELIIVHLLCGKCWAKSFSLSWYHWSHNNSKRDVIELIT